VFADRIDAGQQLGRKVVSYLQELGIGGRPLVLGLPRGGLPVAEQVAGAVGGDLDAIVARKIGFPGQPEFGIGAVAEDGPPLFSYEVLRQAGLTEQHLAGTVERERAEVSRRVRRYRGDRPPPDPIGRVVIVVDDGLATGVTARAAGLCPGGRGGAARPHRGGPVRPCRAWVRLGRRVVCRLHPDHR
jgi:putative phosphoribosyl transferase